MRLPTLAAMTSSTATTSATITVASPMPMGPRSVNDVTSKRTEPLEDSADACADAIDVSCCCAASTDRPGARTPNSLTSESGRLTPRRNPSSIGTQMSGVLGNRNVSETTPTTVRGVPLTRIVEPTGCAGAGNARAAKLWRTRTTGGAPGRASPGTSTRPSSGAHDRYRSEAGVIPALVTTVASSDGSVTFSRPPEIAPRCSRKVAPSAMARYVSGVGRAAAPCGDSSTRRRTKRSPPGNGRRLNSIVSITANPTVATPMPTVSETTAVAVCTG